MTKTLVLVALPIVLVGTIVLVVIEPVVAVSIFLFLGVFFLLASSIGLLRFPDVYTRMHATGVGSTLGIGCIVVSSFLFFNWESGGFSIKELALLAGLLLTCPVSTHLIIQAAYRKKVSLAKGRVVDELKGKKPT